MEPLDPGRTVRELRELRTLTGDAAGAPRPCWAPPRLRARDLLAGRLAGLPGGEPQGDEAGHQWARLAGRPPGAGRGGGGLELHSEQGRVLERLGLPMGAVLGTFGVERHVVRFTGQSAHAGSTPMDVRRDALAAAARFALTVREIATRGGGVATVGRAVARPGIFTA